MEIEEKVKELETEKVNLTKECDELKTKITEADKARAKAEAQAIIKEAVDKAELPEAAKVKLTEQFKEAEKAEGIDIAIKAEGVYLAKITEQGKVKGMGATIPDGEVTKKALRESAKRLHPEYTEAQLDTFVNGR